MAVIKVKSTHPESQGPFVLLESEDFKEGEHELYEEKPADPVKPASHGLNVEQLKTALGEKGIEIPDDAKKADLAKLLDDAAAQ